MGTVENGVAPIKSEYRRKQVLVLPDVLNPQQRQAEAPACPASKAAPEPKSKRQMKKACLQLVICIAMLGRAAVTNDLSVAVL